MALDFQNQKEQAYLLYHKIEDLKHEIVSMLYEEKIMKFDPTNGAKAYSYFGTIVKRWLINYNNKNYKKLKKVGTFDEMQEGYNPSPIKNEDNAISLGTFLDLYVDQTYIIYKSVLRHLSLVYTHIYMHICTPYINVCCSL